MRRCWGCSWSVVSVIYWAEAAGNPIHQALGVVGGNMEGKEVRFGIAATALFAAITTAASCGAVIGMHDSLMPLGGLVTMFNVQLGEVIVGGVGRGILRHPDLRHPGGIYCRADGRTYAPNMSARRSRRAR